MSTLDFNNDDFKKSHLEEYNIRAEKVIEASKTLPMQSQFEYIKQCNNIDKIGVNPKTGRHEMTDLDIKELKLMLKQLMLQKMQQEKLFTQLIK